MTACKNQDQVHPPVAFFMLVFGGPIKGRQGALVTVGGECSSTLAGAARVSRAYGAC